MKDACVENLCNALRAVPDRTLVVRRHDSLSDGQPPLTGPLRAEIEGRGEIETYRLFPGMELSFHRYLAESAQLRHEAVPSVLEIHHCRQGRIGWNMQNRVSVYLGPGDVCLHTGDCCAASRMTFPLGYYEGLSFSADFPTLAAHCPQGIAAAGVDFSALAHTYGAGKQPLAIAAGSTLDRLLSVLYDLPSALRVPYYTLKAQELLLYLAHWEPEGALTPYVSQQTELIREIRDFLVEHLDRRFTIEELAKRYPINTSSLKAVFKTVYGLPIGAYMKEYRIRQACAWLRESDDSIASIADRVGYETQGKFTKAFKELTHTLPTEYRKRYRA